MAIVRRFALFLLAVSVTSCAEDTFEFVCETDKQCDEDGEGLCVRQWCSYPDDGCESGYRYSAEADTTVAEACVPATDLAPG